MRLKLGAVNTVRRPDQRTNLIPEAPMSYLIGASITIGMLIVAAYLYVGGRVRRWPGK